MAKTRKAYIQRLLDEKMCGFEERQRRRQEKRAERNAKAREWLRQAKARGVHLVDLPLNSPIYRKRLERQSREAA